MAKKEIVLLFIIWLLCVGCFNKIVITPKESEVEPKTKAELMVDAIGNKPNYKEKTKLDIVRFEYNSFNLTGKALELLSRNALFLKVYREYDILVEGHCDERGTRIYNMELGRNRANTVKQFYILNGIQEKRIDIVSYGEGKPIAFNSNEGSWFLNRRAETKARKR